ncbi:hypothetical protein Zm00014a_035603 [Zea mays]|uniref:Uncharacterized protein n=1 Tax=Zea mays TaxID=4577 RepID=A0A3L6F4M6_MAIZE|nr:hypothetical protein Zm00014a_035603 [Zea mays]
MTTIQYVHHMHLKCSRVGYLHVWFPCGFVLCAG